MTAMRTPEFLNMVAEAIEVDPSSLTWDTHIADVPEWTSLGWLTLMSLVDEQMNAQLNSKEIRALVTVGDLADYVSRITI
jgi:acyl carrier protein